jgi:DNA-binding Lrp family transcriptional regulator
VKDAVIVLGRETGITNRVLAEALGLGASAVTKRVEAARAQDAESSALVKLRKLVGSRVRSSSNVNKVRPDPRPAPVHHMGGLDQ